MNEELTREVLEAMVKCDTICSRCKAVKLCSEGIFNTLRILATALLAEMDKPKVWDGAPEWANAARVRFCGNGKLCGEREYTRELPKTRARQIAEQEGHRLAEIYGWNVAEEVLVTNRMEAALTKYAEELKGEA